MNIYDLLITIYLVALAAGILVSLAVGRRGWRALLIVLILSIAFFSLWWPGSNGYGPRERLKPGLDLAGGTTLIYDVSIPKGKNPSQVIQDTIAILRARVDPTGTRNLVWREVAGSRIEIQMPLATAETAVRRHAYVEAKDRLLGGNLPKSRLEADLRLKGKNRDKALDELAGRNTTLRGELGELARVYDKLVAVTRPYEKTEQDYRQARSTLDKLSGDASKAKRKQMSQRVAALQKSLESKARAYLKAKRVYEAQLDRALKANISQDELDHIFSLSNQPTRPGQPSPRAAALAKLKQAHRSRAAQIEKVVAAYRSYEKVKGPLDDPQDLEQLLRGSGVLEFRIGASPTAVGDVQGYRDQLRQRGPRSGQDKPWRWFAIDSIKSFTEGAAERKAAQANPKQFFASRAMIGQKYNGQIYLLLGNRPETAMTRNEQGWELTSASRTRDQLGQTALAFELNQIGGELMGQITGPHVGKPMAILLDNKVISAPTLQSRIRSRGQITGGAGGFSESETNYLLRTLKAGSLEGQLGKYPISIETTGPQLGQDNLRAGLSAAIWSLIIVAGFMAAYYFFAGCVADFALAANMVLILGVMAMIHATFTLPGIAGVVLTIGMAVDANVLIYERIREELRRKADVPTAVRLGYEKAFSTIVDANLTTLITCVVLGYTATAEVKGFAVTLGIGILATLFTALFCTHVIMDLWVAYMKPKKMRMLPMVVPIVHRILSPSVDWIGKRYVFMTFSGLAIIASLFLVTIRGKNMLDIEFRSGTQVTFALPKGQTMAIQTVRQRLQTYGQVGTMMDQGKVDVGRLTPRQRKAYEKLKPIAEQAKQRHAQAQVKYKAAIAQGNTPDTVPNPPVDFALFKEVQPVTVGPTTSVGGKTLAHEFSLSTLITDSQAVSDVVKSAFPELKTTRPIDFAGMDAVNVGQAPVISIVHVNSQGKAILGLNINRPDVQNDVTDYLGGVAIVLKDIKPAVTVADLTQRIKRMAMRPAFEHIGYRQFKVMGVDPVVNQQAGGPTRYRSAVVIAHDNETNYQENPQTFTDPTGLAATEWRLVHAALERDTSLASVANFNSQVSKTMQNQALLAMALSLLAVIIYVWFRFGRLTYGLAAIVALIHDVTISLGAVALSGWIFDNAVGHALLIEPFKINLALVAALLTIVGFSLNDTIVVFDRIRENRGRMAFATPQIINDAINQTISRTVLTSSTAMMAVVILYVVGGAGIHGFAYAMMMGVFVGTYSSIAIASPLLLIKPMHKNEGESAGAKTKALSGAARG